MRQWAVIVDPFKNYPGYVLRRASAATMEQLTRRLATLKLRPSEASVLRIIDANPHVTPSEVGRLLNIARANMTPLVARLEALKLIDRRPVNGRSHGLWMTSAGRALVEKVRKIIDQYEEGLLSHIPQPQRSHFMDILNAIWSATEQTGRKR
jgi:DNA-binding MarR family transcriptional regulator